MTALAHGAALSFGLLTAIGAQNALVLRQGLRREHVFATCLFCALSDAVLITAGVSGFAAALQAAPGLASALRWGGVAFLAWYGLRSFRAALRPGGGLNAGDAPAATLRRILAMVAAMTWANPHVWLDTVVLIGSVSARYPGQSASFGAGAAAASFVFFFALGYGARLLAPLFARPRAWQVLDAAVGVIMWAIALRLALG